MADYGRATVRWRMTKFCRGCNQNIPLEGWGKNKKYSDGLNYRCKDCIRSSHRLQPSSVNRLRRAGVTPQEYDRMLEEQGGTCAICPASPEPGRRRFPVDHCHITGRVRGVLCSNCNTALGLLGDDIERLRAAVLYLSASLVST